MIATSCFKEVFGAFEMFLKCQREENCPVLGLTLAVCNEKYLSLNRYHRISKEKFITGVPWYFWKFASASSLYLLVYLTVYFTVDYLIYHRNCS